MQVHRTHCHPGSSSQQPLSPSHPGENPGQMAPTSCMPQHQSSPKACIGSQPLPSTSRPLHNVQRSCTLPAQIRAATTQQWPCMWPGSALILSAMHAHLQQLPHMWQLTWNLQQMRRLSFGGGQPLGAWASCGARSPRSGPGPGCTPALEQPLPPAVTSSNCRMCPLRAELLMALSQGPPSVHYARSAGSASGHRQAGLAPRGGGSSECRQGVSVPASACASSGGPRCLPARSVGTAGTACSHT